ncbi:MAG: response regulator [Actinobacteria bacterium]|nr:response regulator [Actinomycetota bacterium]
MFKLLKEKQGKLILLADDSQQEMVALRNILEVAGYRVVTANNGSEALRLAATHLPDLIILDVTMPMKNGFAVTECLKGYEKTARIPVILISARRTSVEDMNLGYRSGAAYYFTKPLDKPKLMGVIVNIFRDPDGARSTGGALPIASTEHP